MVQRIWICGNSGSGKTTLARQLGEALQLPVYHRDEITWDDDDNMRTEEEQVAMLRDITRQERWIFEGARFTAAQTDGRLERCELIVNLSLNRWLCLTRALRRARRQKNDPAIPPARKQPYHWVHIRYCFWDYPNKHRQRADFFKQAQRRGIRMVELKRRRHVTAFAQSLMKEQPCSTA